MAEKQQHIMNSQVADNGLETPVKGSIHDASIEDNKALDSRITRKIDIRVAPMLCMLYLTAYLDRTNIGNAKLLGLEKELKMPANGYNTAIWTFFLTFVLMEVPSNLLMTHSKIPPNWWLGKWIMCNSKISSISSHLVLKCRTNMFSLLCLVNVSE